MLSMGSFIFTQPNGVLSPWRKGTHCFHLCDAPSTVPVLSIILNKLISGWVARDIKILFCCLLVYYYFFLRLRYVLAMSSALTIPKEMPQINFSTSVQRHINRNYAPCSQGRDLLLEVFSMPPQKQPSDRIPFSILILNRLHTHHVTCEAYTSLIKACSNLNK